MRWGNWKTITITSGLSLAQRIGLTVASLGAIALSSHLLIHWIRGGSLAGCSSGSSCDSLSSSIWGNVLGVPVTAMAIGVYLLLLGALRHLAPMQSPNRRRIACFVLAAGSTAILSAAVWFTAIQLFLGQFCRLCLTTHVIGLMVSLISLRWLYRNPTVGQGDITPLLGRKTQTLAYGIGLLLTLTMAAAQLFFPQEKTHQVQLLGGVADIDQTQPDGQRIVSLLNGRVRLSVSKQPRLGRADAPHLAVFLMDYTCEHCRRLHHDLRQIYEKRAGESSGLAILFLPTTAQDCSDPPATSSQACQLGRLALALWQAAPDQFDAFDQALTAGDAPMPYEQARRLADELAGPDTIRQALADDWPSSQLHRNHMLYRLLKTRRMPVLILGSMLVTGRPATLDELDNLMAEHWPTTDSPASQTLQFRP